MATATKTVEAELLSLEKRYWQALKDQDAETAMRLTDEPCIVTGAPDSSTWVRRDGHWLCAMHTEAIAGDPFGRDRRA